MKTETLKELRRHFRAIEVALLREIEEREKMGLLWIVFAILFSVTPAEAFKFASGTYQSDGVDNRTIDISDTGGGADFQPDVVFVKCNSPTLLVWRNASMTSGGVFRPGQWWAAHRRSQEL